MPPSVIARLRVLIAVFAAGLLAGCWMSEQPFVTSRNAATMQIEGPFQPGEGKEPVRMARNADGSYTMGDGKVDIRVLFLDIGGGWFVMQQDFAEIMRLSAREMGGATADAGATDDGQGQGYVYRLAQVRGNDLVFHDTICDQAIAAIEGVSSSTEPNTGKLVCTFTNADALELAARAMAARIDEGDPAIRSKVLKGIAR